MPRIEAVDADRDQLGEGPLRDVAEPAPYGIDSHGSAVHRLMPGGRRATWLRAGMPEPRFVGRFDNGRE